jgi:N-acetylmuramoyl-L-alanine amidase
MRFLAFALLLTAVPLAAAGQLADLRVDAGGTTRSWNAVAHSGAATYPIAALAQLGGSIIPAADGARVLLAGDTLTFWHTSPFFRRGATLHQLAYPVHASDGQVFLPEQFFIEWLPARYADRFEYRGGTLRARDAALASAAPAAPGRSASPAEPRVIIIDPGHGGPDAGKIAANGLREKDLTLLIARRLASLLSERGYEVHLTRTTDVLVPLDERPRLANRWKDGRAASLFLSIHANSAESRQAAGFETFFLAEARTEDERRVAEIENAAVRFEEQPPVPLPDIEYILTHLRNDFYQRASNDLAGVVQSQLAAFHPGRNRGVKQAGFRVLVGAFMPAVLIEVGFLSNPDEARLLGTSAFQQKVAWGIADAVDAYFDAHAHLLVTERR